MAAARYLVNHNGLDMAVAAYAQDHFAATKTAGAHCRAQAVVACQLTFVSQVHMLAQGRFVPAHAHIAQCAIL